LKIKYSIWEKLFSIFISKFYGMTGAYRVLVGRPEGKDHLEELGVGGRIILKWIFKK
jgi:hypothetical protein